MSKKINKLMEKVTKMQRSSGLSKQAFENVLRGLGKFQALADSAVYSDPQKYSKLQAQMKALNLDDTAISKIVSEVRQLKKTAGLSSGALKEKKVSEFLLKLRQVQAQMAEPQPKSAVASKNIADLQKVMKQAGSKLNSINWKDKKVQGYLKKLKKF